MKNQKEQQEEKNSNSDNMSNENETVENKTEEVHQEAVDEAVSEKKSKKPKKDKGIDKVEELGLKLAELSDRHLRLQAEFDNFRKRTLKEKTELIKSGGETVLTNILPIIDDFDRALNAMSEVPEEDPAKIGFLLIFNKFKDFLKQNNVLEIEALGQSFDVDLHDAVTKIPAPSEEKKGKIIDVIQKGYLLNGKVIRYSKVVIGD